MSKVTDRAKSLARIGEVQAQMVELAEARLAAARRARDALHEERRLLAGLVGGEEALGVGLARAALRTAKALNGRIGAAERQVVALEDNLQRLRRRDKAVAAIAGAARQAKRREDEGRALEATMEAWLARASLP